MVDYRIERDSMGEMQVPAGAYYGASTQRAVENFPISKLRFGRRFIWALGLIKWAAAKANKEMGRYEAEKADAVMQACDEVMDGKFDDEFVVDIFQTGSGTSTNMNANEVIANRATEILGGTLGSKLVHPNDHVNNGQSSNDVIPTAIHLAAAGALREDLLPALGKLAVSLDAKAEEFKDVVKTGRTHLMDATPVTLGQEFSGYATQVHKGAERMEKVLPELEELALGGTAVGTGLNAPVGLVPLMIRHIADRSGYPFREADNHFEAQAAKDAVVATSGMLKTVATSLFKIANDLRWLSSGPRTAIGEIRLPTLQPGSSIMPGKINPVIPEAVMQVAGQVIGNDVSVTWGGANGNFELNVMMPLMSYNLIESIDLLANVSTVLAEKCVDGIEANVERATELVERDIIIITALAPHVGYDKAADIAHVAMDTNRGVREVALEMSGLSAEELDKVLDLKKMTEGGVL
ncbi:MAG TPA: class II fumarate hydratase [Actinobacteria bacterium]|nr:class II fumarate hydratase [Actinomycetota bacterium]HDL48721.1 class II fumarate hydratase [Actinomycetota bacterium]